MAEKRMTPIRSDSTEREYYRNILKYVRAYQSILRQELELQLPEIEKQAKEAIPETLRTDSVARMDAGVDKKLKKLFGKVQKRLEKIFPESMLEKWSEAMLDQVNNLTKKNMAGYMRSVNQAEIEPLLTDKGLTPYFKEKVANNVGLIRSIGTDKHPELKNRLAQLLSNDATSTQISKEIQKHFGVTKNRANLIARDQIGKINGELDQHRQTQMGVKKYRWRTMKDMRVTGRPGGLYPEAKPSHWDREGEIFSWDKPPEGGAPKRRIGCRCYAEPILDDLLE